MIWRERKRDLSLLDSTRNIMATIMNFAGRSLKKGVMKRPQDIIRLPHDGPRKAKDFDVKKLWKKELTKNRKV
jgi:hypothetical protein